MIAAEFVEGDKSSMCTPKVLHKDLDYLNFNSSNLRWVEEASQEYQDYMKRKGGYGSVDYQGESQSS